MQCYGSIYLHFEGPCCLHLQGENRGSTMSLHGVTAQNMTESWLSWKPQISHLVICDCVCECVCVCVWERERERENLYEFYKPGRMMDDLWKLNALWSPFCNHTLIIYIVIIVVEQIQHAVVCTASYCNYKRMIYSVIKMDAWCGCTLHVCSYICFSA
jgi:hypothetical protein